jgi:hypothetical protein
MRIPMREFHDWDYSNPQILECSNHPECQYHWKGPGRNLHYISMLAKECTCNISDLVVVDKFTLDHAKLMGTFALSNSGPQYKYAVRGGAYTIAVFEPECESFATEYVEELAPKYNDGWIKIVLV